MNEAILKFKLNAIVIKLIVSKAKSQNQYIYNIVRVQDWVFLMERFFLFFNRIQTYTDIHCYFHTLFYSRKSHSLFVFSFKLKLLCKHVVAQLLYKIIWIPCDYYGPTIIIDKPNFSTYIHVKFLHLFWLTFLLQILNILHNIILVIIII